jgi:hypothetical protein
MLEKRAARYAVGRETRLGDVSEAGGVEIGFFGTSGAGGGWYLSLLMASTNPTSFSFFGFATFLF